MCLLLCRRVIVEVWVDRIEGAVGFARAEKRRHLGYGMDAGNDEID